MNTFKMPGLSRYTFDIEGNCYKQGIRLKVGLNYKSKGYKITLDDKTLQFVKVDEIVKYGKHLKEMSFINLLEKTGVIMELVEPKKTEYIKTCRFGHMAIAN